MALEQIDQSTWQLEPGLFEIHAHPRAFDPILADSFVPTNRGTEGKAGLEIFTRVALYSGFTGMAAMSNESMRIIDPTAALPERTILIPYSIANLDRVRALQAAIIRDALIPTGLHGGIDPSDSFLDSNSERINEDLLHERFAAMAGECLGLKVYLAETTGGYNIDKRHAPAVARIWHEHNPDAPMIMHVEGDDVREVLQAIKEMPNGRQIQLHVAHVSSQVELEAVLAAKAEGMNVSTEVTLHHLYLDVVAEQEIGPLAKVKPSLKLTKDIAYLRQHIGEIDIIATDCAPHRRQDKRGESAMPGITSHDMVVPLLMGAVAEGWITLEQVYDKLCIRPRERFNLPLNDQSYTRITNDPFSTRAPYRQREYLTSPLAQLKQHFLMIGRVVAAKAGESTYDGYQFNARPSYSHLIRPKLIGARIVHEYMAGT